MRRGMVVDYTVVAGMLANESDNVQAAFFDTFVQALKRECGTKWFTSVQVAALIGRASDETREVMLWDSEED